MMNQCNFIGRLGADPEIRRTQDGRPIANLRLAVSERWRDKNTGEQREKTEWVPVVIFSEGLCRVAENYLSKGSLIQITGKYQTRKWQDQEGKDRFSTEVVLQGFDAKLTMLDRQNGNSGRPGNQAPDDSGSSYGGSSGGGGAGPMDDEIPF